MSDQITITLPKIDETIISAIETETLATQETETLAIAALRTAYAPLARQNGYIKTSYHIHQTSNFCNERETWYRHAGRKVKALLIIDNFRRTHNDENSGDQVGKRLYLAMTGTESKWIELEREGTWSAWQGTPEGWCAGADDAEYDGEYADPSTGSLKIINDEQVASQYKLIDVVDGLSDSLTVMAKKLPERLTKVRQRATLASQLLASLK